MNTPGDACFATWPTELGPITVAYSPMGLCGVIFGGNKLSVDGRHPAWIVELRSKLQAHLSGAPQPLQQVPVDWRGVTPFRRDVYIAAQQISPGTTTTYSKLAAQLGRPGGARAVGQALAANPYLLVVPCHRIVAADGRLRGFSAPGGLRTKARLLVLENAHGHAMESGFHREEL